MPGLAFHPGRNPLGGAAGTERMRLANTPTLIECGRTLDISSYRPTLANDSHYMRAAMPATSLLKPACPDQIALLAGTLAHLSNYMHTGCPRSVHLARLLLHRMDHQPAFDRDLLDSCRTLEQAITEAHAAPQRA